MYMYPQPYHGYPAYPHGYPTQFDGYGPANFYGYATQYPTPKMPQQLSGSFFHFFDKRYFLSIAHQNVSTF